jgi:exopolysaccharide production protein ExoQ
LHFLRWYWLQLTPFFEFLDQMPPILALFLWFVLLIALLYLDPARDRATSAAIWVPLIWMFIISSRLPSQWIGAQSGLALQAYEEGNPLDRTIFFGLIALSVVILVSRSFKWGDFFARNLMLTAFLFFALMSVFWSDFPFITFKKWFRDLGIYLVVLVALSDARPLEAIRTLLRRLSFVLIPLSIVLVKYYPALGRQYSEWSGAATYTGVATTKDELGAICLVSGLFFFWDTWTRWSNRRDRRTKQIILVNIAFIAMTLYLMVLADSATCRVCLVLGCLLIVLSRSGAVKRHPTPLKILVPLGVCLSLFLVFGADMKASIAGAVGRDPTFTDRTLLWSYLLNMKINPVLGTGYESFWLGPRLAQLWKQFAFLPNQAHDGYIELYLDLGLIGAFLLGGFLIASYRTISSRIGSDSGLGSLGLALWAIIPLYNITTASFGRSELLWLTFLLVAIAVPGLSEDRIHRITLEGQETAQPSARFHLVTQRGDLREPSRREADMRRRDLKCARGL